VPREFVSRDGTLPLPEGVEAWCGRWAGL